MKRRPPRSPLRSLLANCCSNLSIGRYLCQSSPCRPEDVALLSTSSPPRLLVGAVSSLPDLMRPEGVLIRACSQLPLLPAAASCPSHQAIGRTSARPLENSAAAILWSSTYYLHSQRGVLPAVLLSRRWPPRVEGPGMSPRIQYSSLRQSASGGGGWLG
jgi:hypothetical protein